MNSIKEIYQTAIVNVLGVTAPFQYEVSLKDAANGEAQVADIRTGIYNTIEEVIECFEWELKERLRELIRENLKDAIGVRFSLQDAYLVTE